MIKTETLRFAKTWALAFFYLTCMVIGALGLLFAVGTGLVALHAAYGPDAVFVTLFGSVCILFVGFFSYYWAKSVIREKDLEAQRTMDILKSERIYGYRGKAPKF